MLAINPKIKQKAEDIRKKIFGSEVRESLASGIEAISEDVEETIGRQDYVEEQFQNVIDETTGKDVISAPELIAARNGKSNLKTRLDDEHAQVTTQLALNTKFLIPTGTGNDTSYLQESIDNNPSVTLLAGDYYVNATLDYTWRIPSNREIIFREGAVLHALTNDQADSRVIWIEQVENINIYNPMIYGDRLTHVGSTHTGGHGIGIYGSNNINIYNPICNDCQGSGIVVAGGENIFVDNAICDNAYMNGISLIHGKNITFNNPLCTNTNGTAPEAGIDIEPNKPTELLENINIINPKTINNSGAGILIMIDNLADSAKEVSINIINHFDKSSRSGLEVARLKESATGNLSGKINIEKPVYRENKRTGISINSYSARKSPSIFIDNPTIINPNESNVSPKYGDGIQLMREIGVPYSDLQGNVTIRHPEIRDIRTIHKMRYGISAIDEKGFAFENVNIIDPIAIEGTAEEDVNYKINIGGNGVTVKDSYEVAKDSFGSSKQLLKRVYTKLSTREGGGAVNMLLDTSDVVINAPTTFINKSLNGLTIVPPSEAVITPLSTIAGKKISSKQVGASITLKRTSPDNWIIENMVGTWTVET